MTENLHYPVLVVNFHANDRQRIQETLGVLKLGCTDEQAEQIRAHLAPLPDDEIELRTAVMQCVEVDWDKCPDQREPAMRDLIKCWNQNGFRQKKVIEMQMLVITKGMDEHPEWWTFPCLCDMCLSYGDQ